MTLQQVDTDAKTKKEKKNKWLLVLDQAAITEQQKCLTHGSGG